jgi:hypothetical protein
VQERVMSERDALAEELRRAANGENVPASETDLRYADQRDAVAFTAQVHLLERPAIVARLDAEARARGTTRAALIREAIRQYLDRQEETREA